VLTKTIEFTAATVREFGHIEVRMDTVVRDGEDEQSRLPHRHVLTPGDDLTGEHPRVQAIATAAWTPEVVARYQTVRAAAEARQRALDAALPLTAPVGG
jgi:hypothetical protein